LEHPEMEGPTDRIAETVAAPDGLIESRQEATVHLYYRRYDETPVTQKFLLVAVKFLDDDAFVITAFFTSRTPQGAIVWLKSKCGMTKTATFWK
jgi:hypothetical protein